MNRLSEANTPSVTRSPGYINSPEFGIGFKMKKSPAKFRVLKTIFKTKKLPYVNRG